MQAPPAQALPMPAGTPLLGPKDPTGLRGRKETKHPPASHEPQTRRGCGRSEIMTQKHAFSEAKHSARKTNDEHWGRHIA